MAPTLLIFGTSHTDKSTLAQKIGDALGWPVTSTDGLARHPGRPWLSIPEAAAEHYDRLSNETIYWFLRVHQDNIWPHVSAQITRAGSGTVFEGSALRPDLITRLPQDGIEIIGLCADDAFLRHRMQKSANYHQLDVAQRMRTDKYITRSLRQNEDFQRTAIRLGIKLLDASQPGIIDAFAQDFIARHHA